MRLDYIFYALALVFFMMTAVSLALVADQGQRDLWVVATVILGLFSAGLGFYKRPKEKAKAESAPAVKQATMPQPQPAKIDDAHEAEALRAENVERVAEPLPMLPQSASPLPMPVVAPMPVLPAAPVEAEAAPVNDLKKVKGIGEKRAAQLKALGLNNVDDLAAASAGVLAAELGVSRKVAEKWVSGAKELVE